MVSAIFISMSVITKLGFMRQLYTEYDNDHFFDDEYYEPLHL
jgi:hypothetical protein